MWSLLLVSAVLAFTFVLLWVVYHRLWWRYARLNYHRLRDDSRVSKLLYPDSFEEYALGAFEKVPSWQQEEMQRIIGRRSRPGSDFIESIEDAGLIPRHVHIVGALQTLVGIGLAVTLLVALVKWII